MTSFADTWSQQQPRDEACGAGGDHCNPMPMLYACVLPCVAITGRQAPACLCCSAAASLPP